MNLRRSLFCALIPALCWSATVSTTPGKNPAIFFEMLRAANKGDLAALEKILDGGTSLYETDAGGFTVAHYAAVAGKWDIVEGLFARGYEPTELTHGRADNPATYQRGLEILPEAAQQGRLDWVKRLLDLGIDTDARKATGLGAQDPLCLALANKHLDVARLLLDTGCPTNRFYILDKEYDKYGAFTALHLAIWNRDLGIVEKIVLTGADLDLQTNNGQSPLMLAAAYDWLEGVEFLLSAGASLTTLDVSKRDVWTFAEHNAPIRQALVRKQMGITKGQTASPAIELILAIEADNQDAVVKLLQTPALANATDNNGVPVLVYASRAGRLECVRSLLGAKANPNKQSPDGDSAIYQAVASGHEGVARLLLEAGADPNIYAPAGWSPLERAIKLKEFETAELLLEKGASPDIPAKENDSGRKPPICLAAQAGNLRIVSLLFEKGANIQAKDSDGVGALTYVCEAEDPAVMQFLVTHGLDINAVTPNGDTPLAIAVMIGNPAMVKMALQLGAKPVALGRAIHQMMVGSPKREEILALLKAKDSEEISDDVFWDSFPSRQAIIDHIKGGGNPNYAGRESPIFSALHKGDFDLAQFLLDHGANPNISGHVHGSTLWALVVGANTGGEERAVEFATRLLRAGVKPDGDTNDLYVAAPINLAVQQGRAGIVEVLLQFGADPELGRAALSEYGARLAPDLQVRIRKLLDKTWPKPLKL